MNKTDLARLCKESYALCTFTVNECEVFIVTNDQYQIVIARGTEADDLIFGGGWLDLIRDARMMPWYDKDCGWCQSGFLKGGQVIAKELEKRLDKNKPIIFTGHSLGGALSLIASIKLMAAGFNVFDWVGIASPKPFLFTGRKSLGFTMINYRNRGDLITTCPRLYSHDYDTIQLGKERFLNLKDHGINEYIKALEKKYG